MARRRSVLVLVGAVLLALSLGCAPRASAGEYAVYACEPAYGDVNHSWTVDRNTPRMSAYVNCPVPWNETRDWNRGLVTLHPTSGATAGQPVTGMNFASLVFSAPRGAALSRITYSHAFCGGGTFEAGLINAAGQWLHESGPGFCGTMVPNPYTLSLGGTPLLRLATMCARAKCDDERAYATIRSATVWVADSTPPSVGIAGGSLVASGWHGGTQSVVVSASDNVGVREADIYLDNKQSAAIRGSCNWTYTVPCTTPLGRVSVATPLVADGQHILKVTAQDSAGNWGATSTRIFVDNTPPTSPQDLRLVGGDAWRTTNSFAVNWANPPQLGTAPISAVNWQICPPANKLEDMTGCTSGWQRVNDNQVSNLRVPGPGDWVGRFWLADAAGNSDQRTAATVHLRYDPNAPDIAIQPPTPSDPQRVTVTASDALSGLARVEVEVRRDGDDAWLALPVSSSAGQFVAYVDDAKLRRGRYFLRARAVDVAGNERTTEARAGAPAILILPLRLQPSFHVGMAKRVKGRRGHRRTVLRRHPLVRFGKTVTLRGRVTLPGGNALAGVQLQVFERTTLPGQPWRRVGIVRTSKHGRFSFRALHGASRRLRFVYGGTPLIKPRAAEIGLRVRARTTFRVNRRHVVNGDEVRFHGRVRGHIPRGGKLLQLQAYSRGTWRTFATPRASHRTHRWHYRYRFSATRGLVRYRFRAVLPTEAGFPYARGTSHSIHVTVRGL